MKKIIIIITAVLIFVYSAIIYAVTENEEKMINAVKLGDIRTIQTLLSQNISPMTKDERGYTLLHIAAENNKIDSIKALRNSPYTDLNTLLEINAKVRLTNNEYIDGSYYSAMDIATINNNFEIVKLLIGYGANINFQMKEKPRTEFLASRYSNPQILELYLNKNIYLLMNSEDVISLITSAVLGNNMPNINYLVKTLGIDVDTKDTNTMLHYAVGIGSVEAANELIKFGANVNNTNANFQTPLHYAVENNVNRMNESVKLLMSSKASPNIQDKNGDTPLHIAVNNYDKAEKKYLEAISIIISRNTDLSILNNKKQTALNITVEKNNTDASILLINAKSLINANTDLNNIYNGYAPIHTAIKNNNKEIVKALLLNGCDVNIKDTVKNYSPLRTAIENNNAEICMLLLNNKANIIEEDINAAKKINNKDIINLLESKT